MLILMTLSFHGTLEQTTHHTLTKDSQSMLALPDNLDSMYFRSDSVITDFIERVHV